MLNQVGHAVAQDSPLDEGVCLAVSLGEGVTTNPKTQQKQVSQNRHLDTPLQR